MDLRRIGITTGLLGLPPAWAALHLITTYGDGNVDWDDTRPGSTGSLHAIAEHAALWQSGVYVAIVVPILTLGFVLGVARVTTASRVLAPIATGLGLVGAVGMGMHAAFYNLVKGVAASPGADFVEMALMSGRIEGYPPFQAMLAVVIVGTTLGYVLLAGSLLRTRAVPWWAAVGVLAFVVGVTWNNTVAVLVGCAGLLVGAVAVTRQVWLRPETELARDERRGRAVGLTSAEYGAGVHQ